MVNRQPNKSLIILLLLLLLFLYILLYYIYFYILFFMYNTYKAPWAPAKIIVGESPKKTTHKDKKEENRSIKAPTW